MKSGRINAAILGTGNIGIANGADFLVGGTRDGDFLVGGSRSN